MSHIVIDHHHDPDGEVYRLIIGIPIIEDRPLEHDGTPVLTCSECDQVIGKPTVIATSTFWDGHTDQCSRQELPGDVPVTEPVLAGYNDVRDYVFADDDDRWDGRSTDEIADAQRRLVAAALDEADNPEPPPPVTVMPGTGEPLR